MSEAMDGLAFTGEDHRAFERFYACDVLGAAPPKESGWCAWILTSGYRAGENCARTSTEGIYCPQHRHKSVLNFRGDIRLLQLPERLVYELEDLRPEYLDAILADGLSRYKAVKWWRDARIDADGKTRDRFLESLSLWLEGIRARCLKYERGRSLREFANKMSDRVSGVYMIRARSIGVTKIGCSKNVKARILSHGTDLPLRLRDDLVVLRVVETDLYKQFEAVLHAILAQQRLGKDEFFQLPENHPVHALRTEAELKAFVREELV